MPIISEKDREFLRGRFEQEMDRPVTITLFTQTSKLTIPGRECLYCDDTQRLMEEVASLSAKITLDVKDFYNESGEAARFGADKVPFLVFHADGGKNIRFSGIPLGYEFAEVIETISALSKGEPDLKPETVEAVKQINEDLHIQVFVTPT